MEGVPCQSSEACKYYPNCYQDTDHYYWPSNEYTGIIEHKFRNLAENKREVCREWHDERHATEVPPEKPDYEVMEHAVVLSGVHLSRKARKALRAHDQSRVLG